MALDTRGKTSNKEKIAILVFWFVLLLSVRILLGFVLSNVWLGSIGAVAITFAIFYFGMKYTYFGKYRPKVVSTLVEWYKKKYVILSLVASTLVVSGIILIIEYGYVHHADKLLSISDIENMENAKNQVNRSVHELSLRGYSFMDIVSIVAASVDKTLEGYYVKTASFLFAENIEIMAFLIFIRTNAEIFSAGLKKPSPLNKQAL